MSTIPISLMVAQLGTFFVTRKAAQRLNKADAMDCLERHMIGDYGDVHLQLPPPAPRLPCCEITKAPWFAALLVLVIPVFFWSVLIPHFSPHTTASTQ